MNCWVECVDDNLVRVLITRVKPYIKGRELNGLTPSHIFYSEMLSFVRVVMYICVKQISFIYQNKIKGYMNNNNNNKVKGDKKN